MISLSGFKSGDVVQLKSGGEMMTVQGPSTMQGLLFCVWHNKDGNRCADSFFPVMLRKISEHDLELVPHPALGNEPNEH